MPLLTETHSDTGRNVWDHKNERMPAFTEEGHCFWVVGTIQDWWGGLPFMKCDQWRNMDPPFWARNKMTIHRMASYSPRIIQNSFLSRKGDGNCLLGHEWGDSDWRYGERSSQECRGICCYPGDSRTECGKFKHKKGRCPLAWQHKTTVSESQIPTHLVLWKMSFSDKSLGMTRLLQKWKYCSNRLRENFYWQRILTFVPKWNETTENDWDYAEKQCLYIMYLHINPQENANHRRKFGDDDKVTVEVKTWLWQTPELLQKGLQALVFR